MDRIDALFIDLDSTILDESYVGAASFAACLRIAEERPGLDPKALAQENVRTFLEHWPADEPEWVLGRLTSDYLRLQTWRRTLSAFGIVDEDFVERAAASHHAIEVSMYQAFDDVATLLDAAADAGVRTAVVTNGASDTQREKLTALGLFDRFDAIIISAEVDAAKPHPRIFAAALEALAVEPSRAGHVGDNLRADVAGARAAGIRSFWLNRAGAAAEEDGPDHDIRSLAEIVPYLNRADSPG